MEKNMTTKKADKSTKKAPKPSAAAAPELGADPLPKSLRAALAQAEQDRNASICRQIDDLANEFIRKACANKYFAQTSGNCNFKECQRVDEPKIEPCLRLTWGDGAQDQLETEDTEVLCLTVCNPYSNVSLNNFTVQLYVSNANGTQVANLPDGTPSVQIKPSHMICFDDIPPCDPQNPEQSCVTREVVLLTRGAIVAQYRVWVIYCFNACFTRARIDAGFVLDLVAS